MLENHPDILVNAFKAASLKLDYFINNSFAENILWLKEIEDAARKEFGSASLTLLPKTPSMKRKRPDNINRNENLNFELSKLVSTFDENVKTKKMRIENMSAIGEKRVCTTCEESVLDLTDMDTNSNKSFRHLRTRTNKVPVQPVKRSKRLAAKGISTKYYESPDDLSASTFEVQSNSPVTVLTTQDYYPVNISPTLNSSNVPVSCAISKSLSSTNANTNMSSPVSNVQPKVAAIIEQLHRSVQKYSKKGCVPSPAGESAMHVKFKDIKDVQTILFPEDYYADSPTKKLDKPAPDVKSPPELFKPMEIAVIEKTPSNTILASVQSPAVSTPKSIQAIIIEETAYEDLSGESSHEPPINIDCEAQDNCDKQELFQPQKVDETNLQEFTQVLKTTKSSDDTVSKDGENIGSAKGRRDTYKVVVMEKELPIKSTPQHIAVSSKLLFAENNDSPVINHDETACLHSELSTGPKIIKPIKVGNIVTGINSFLKKNKDSPKKETDEERRMKKAAELEKKEHIRMKNLGDGILQKQKQQEQRKIERLEREKRIAEQLRKRQEDDEKKKQIIENKLQLLSKHKEYLRKQKEIEEEKRREQREMKRVEADARRQEEEELRKQRALRQMEEDDKRREALQLKAEIEKQERLKKKLENERIEKGRLKALEEERLLNEQRKLREFEEKERHRLEIERKLKEQRDQERMEKQKQEERLKAAEEEIQEAKKKEQNGDRNKPKEEFITPAIPKVCPYCARRSPPKVPTVMNESLYVDYNIDDLSSEDNTDDEAEPDKRIPSWAQGIKLRTQLMQQFYANIDPDLIFVNCMETCRLDKIFQKKKERYFKRTSSAHWTSPVLKSSLYVK